MVPTEPGGPLQGEEATHFKAFEARLNYLALDRPDIQYALKEAAKRMSAPCVPDRKRLKR